MRQSTSLQPTSLQLAVVLGAVAMGFPSLAFTQDRNQADPAALEQQWTEFANPGSEHKQMARLVGEWKAEVKSYEPGADQSAANQGTATFRMLLGGRYLQQNFRANFGGAEFRGMGITGYDKTKKKFVSSWIDNMGTGIMNTEGQYDEQKHEMLETGVMSSPAGEQKVKMVTHYESEDQFTFTLYTVNGSGEEAKVMEIVYARTSEPRAKKKKQRAR